MWRSAYLAAREAELSDFRPTLQKGHLQEDNPLHPWCFCQKTSDGNFMIMCDQQGDNCYHGKCVGISPEEGRHMETNNELFICPSCS